MKLKLGAFLRVFSLACLAAPISAAVASTNSPSLSSPSTGVLEILIRMIGAVCLVAALLISAAWLFKRSRFFPLVKGAESQLKILESRAVGNRNSLLVIQYSDQKFLLSVCATGINFLSTLPPSAPSPMVPSPFAEKLSEAQQRKP